MSKIINVTSASMPPLNEYIDEIRDLWETHWLTHSGPKHHELEKKLCEYLKVENTSLFANGHLALEMALEALKLTGEVITTPFTFASTTQAILHTGLTPVFCDILPDDYTIDANKIEDLITEKTTAILPVHVYGNICDYKKIKAIADKYNLKVIYDAAHAFGEEIDGIGVGSLGDISMFSFHATKVFNTIEGGGLTYGCTSLKKEFSALRQFGMYGKEDAEMIGTNAKMTEFQAAMGICNLRHVEQYISKRKELVTRYNDLLSGKKGIVLCEPQKNVTSNYAYFPVLFNEKILRYSRDDVSKHLEDNGIFARKYFFPLTSNFTVCRKSIPIQQTPIAEKVADRVLTLPLYSDLELEDVDRICDIIIHM